MKKELADIIQADRQLTRDMIANAGERLSDLITLHAGMRRRLADSQMELLRIQKGEAGVGFLLNPIQYRLKVQSELGIRSKACSRILKKINRESERIVNYLTQDLLESIMISEQLMNRETKAFDGHLN